MYITTKRGIFIIYGEKISSLCKSFGEGQVTLRTTTSFKDQKGITREGEYTWVVNITNGQTREIDPTRRTILGPMPTHLVIEATPYDDYDKFWHYPNGRNKRRLRLKALFVSELEEYRAHWTPTGIADAVEYEPKGSSYMIWWRPDEIADNDSLVTGIIDPYMEGHYDEDYQDPIPMRDDMEFFYEDERWSRDP